MCVCVCGCVCVRVCLFLFPLHTEYQNRKVRTFWGIYILAGAHNFKGVLRCGFKVKVRKGFR